MQRKDFHEGLSTVQIPLSPQSPGVINLGPERFETLGFGYGVMAHRRTEYEVGFERVTTPERGFRFTVRFRFSQLNSEAVVRDTSCIGSTYIVGSSPTSPTNEIKNIGEWRNW